MKIYVIRQNKIHIIALGGIIMTGEMFGTVVGYLLGVLIAFCVAKILLKPIKFIIRIIINSILGVCFLALLNYFSPFLHIYIGINAVSALVLGVLGVPGLCLLMLLKIFF